MAAAPSSGGVRLQAKQALVPVRPGGDALAALQVVTVARPSLEGMRGFATALVKHCQQHRGTAGGGDPPAAPAAGNGQALLRFDVAPELQQAVLAGALGLPDGGEGRPERCTSLLWPPPEETSGDGGGDAARAAAQSRRLLKGGGVKLPVL